MAEKLLATLQSLLHLQPEQAGFGAGHGARVVALLLVELVAAFIQGIDLALPVSPCLPKAPAWSMRCIPVAGTWPHRSCSSVCMLGATLDANSLTATHTQRIGLTLNGTGLRMAGRVCLQSLFGCRRLQTCVSCWKGEGGRDGEVSVP